MRFLFDVDETLIHNKYRIGEDVDTPNEPILAILCALAASGHRIYVSSGGGVSYAEGWCRRLGIEELVEAILPKDPKILKVYGFDASFDDMPTNFGTVNLLVYNEVPATYTLL